MRVTIEAAKCVASGQCVMLAPDVFDQDDNGIVTLLLDEPPEDERENVREAALVCPARLIHLAE
jgi:ferredoxin